MRIAQVAPLAEAVPPLLYGGTERIVSYLTEELVALGRACRNLCVAGPTLPRGAEGCMAIRNELVEELLAGHDPSEVFAKDGLLDELKKALAERALNAEMDHHLRLRGG